MRTFGGSLGNYGLTTYEGYFRREILDKPEKFADFDYVYVGDQWSVKLPITEFCKDAPLIGKITYKVTPQEAYELAQVASTEPIELDFILCQIWHDMGRAARLLYLSKDDMLKYRVWSKIKIPDKTFKLRYHEDTPRYTR